MKKTMTFLVFLFGGFILSGCGKGNKSNEITIAVLPKGTTHTFWQSIHAGAIKASKEVGVKVIWVAPEKEDDRQQQISLVDNQVLNGVSAICLAPLDAKALFRPVADAAKNKISVVIFDSGLENSVDITVSYVATNNLEGGRMAGRNMGKVLNGKGKVIMLRYAEGSASTEEREKGFLETIKEFPGIEMISQEQYGGATATLAQQASENLLVRFRNEKGQLTADGIFTSNESSTYGMLQALRRAGIIGKVKFLGFDSSKPLIDAVRQKEIDGLVVQNPFNMGYLCVKTAAAHLRGEKIERVVDTGVHYVDLENIDSPESQNFINPEIDKWLKAQ